MASRGTRRRILRWVAAVVGCWLFVAFVRLERQPKPRLASDILDEMDRRGRHMPRCPALLTATTLESLRQSCPDFVTWSDAAAITYWKLHQTGRLVVYSPR